MSSESGSNEMDAGSWIIILMLTCSPFLAFGCVSFTIFCCDCNQDGDVVLLRSGWWVRRRLIERSLVTKVSADHLDEVTISALLKKPRALGSKDIFLLFSLGFGVQVVLKCPGWNYFCFINYTTLDAILTTFHWFVQRTFRQWKLTLKYAVLECA